MIIVIMMIVIMLLYCMTCSLTLYCIIVLKSFFFADVVLVVGFAIKSSINKHSFVCLFIVYILIHDKKHCRTVDCQLSYQLISSVICINFAYFAYKLSYVLLIFLLYIRWWVDTVNRERGETQCKFFYFINIVLLLEN